MGNSNYLTSNSQDDMSLFDDDLDSYIEKSAKERATDVSGTTDNSNAYVCESLDEPSYISANHAYYPGLPDWQLDVEAPSWGIWVG
jgi:hypothetical protein